MIIEMTTLCVECISQFRQDASHCVQFSYDNAFDVLMTVQNVFFS